MGRISRVSSRTYRFAKMSSQRTRDVSAYTEQNFEPNDPYDPAEINQSVPLRKTVYEPGTSPRYSSYKSTFSVPATPPPPPIIEKEPDTPPVTPPKKKNTRSLFTNPRIPEINPILGSDPEFKPTGNPPSSPRSVPLIPRVALLAKTVKSPSKDSKKATDG